jgi:putative Mn2+ efflux pump MntP
MGLFEIMLIGVGLAMDCLAVSLASGTCLKKINFGTAAKVGLFLAFFRELCHCLAGFSELHSGE